jgi:hypothetical protein
MKSKVANTVCQPYSHAEGNQGITKACKEGKENGGVIDIASHVQPPDPNRNPDTLDMWSRTWSARS